MVLDNTWVKELCDKVMDFPEFLENHVKRFPELYEDGMMNLSMFPILWKQYGDYGDKALALSIGKMMLEQMENE